MGRLRYPAPESHRTEHGLTVHRWPGAGQPVLLIHGFASNTLFNWVKTGWLDPLADTGVHGDREILSVDLPGHGTSREVNPAGLRITDILSDLNTLVAEFSTPVHLHGYSLGSRIAWSFAAAHPQQVTSLVMGGSPTSDDVYQVHAGQARRWALGGDEPEDHTTREFIAVAKAIPEQHLPHVVELRLSLAADAYDPAAAVPAVDTLVVAGDKDSIAAEAPWLRDLVADQGATSSFISLPGRNHVNALTSRDYKSAVTDFIS